MDLDLTGRKALVTGSTGGIGYAIARALSDLGADVGINGRTADRVEAALTRLGGAAKAGRPLAATGDVATAEGAAALVAALPAVDILVNDTGIFEPKTFFEIPDADWQRFLDVNVMSGIRLSRAYAPAMAERGWGRVEFISSESAINVPTGMVHYGMSKIAPLAISRGLAQTVAGSGVTVNSVLPGPTLSEGVAASMKQMAGGSAEVDLAMGRTFVAERRPSSLIKRRARVEEVANLVAYLRSPAASATTGAALRLDGGRAAGSRLARASATGRPVRRARG